MTGGIWRDLIDVARWTPSPHNTQPWRIRPLGDRAAELWLDESRTLPDEDTTGCFIRCAMGMFIESLSIAAAERGLTLRECPFQGPACDGLLPFAQLDLVPGPPQEPLASRDILDRRTSRLPGAAVGDADLCELASIAAGGGQKLTWTDDHAQIDAIMAANMDAVSHDLNDRRYHDEIVRWFRFGRRHAARTRDGLASNCMNMPAHELWITARVPGLLNWRATRRVMRSLYERRLAPVRQLAFLSGPFFEPATAAPAAGRTLMRLWLHMHRRGVSIHPFGNLVTNPIARQQLTSLTRTEHIWLVFRIGRTAMPARSERLPAEALLC